MPPSSTWPSHLARDGLGQCADAGQSARTGHFVKIEWLFLLCNQESGSHNPHKLLLSALQKETIFITTRRPPGTPQSHVIPVEFGSLQSKVSHESPKASSSKGWGLSVSHLSL